jgi:uncharacterized protein
MNGIIAAAARLLVWLFLIPCTAYAALAGEAVPALPSDIPAKFKPNTDSYDFIKREEMIPMRDGVKLKTVILIPKGVKNAPILLTRTPYSAARHANRNPSPHLQSVLSPGDDVVAVSGYIRVFQDVRGKFGSEGDYVMTRPVRGPLNPTGVDHSTDAYDTIDWLVKNVPESNGKVGIIGGSYDGFTTLMALIRPHPALKVAVPINPKVDDWIGDDRFHQGAFRTVSMSYIYGQESTRKSEEDWTTGYRDDYSAFLAAGSVGALGKALGMEQLGFWREILQHPAYDSFWQNLALDKILAREPVSVPTLLVHGLWDQEDIYGALAVYKALKSKDPHHLLHLAMGPWRHGGSNGDGSALGPLRFDGDTALYFRRQILQPFLDRYLKDGAPKAHTPPVLAYETGSNSWRRYPSWPRSCATGCPEHSQTIYLRSGGKLGFQKPAESQDGFDDYVSDPAKPVPYRLRPDLTPRAKDSTWGEWLVDDQRNFGDRPDVLAYVSDPLVAPLRISGESIAHLFAATSGTDVDWVVKLIDVYPDEYPSEPVLGGYQLMIAADILRGRYREDFSRPQPIEAGKILPYTVRLPHANHVFEPGHRIMIQIQSSWFPLYDRNPQTYVDNIFFARPEDYKKATQRIYHTPNAASSIELPVTTAPR